MKKIAVLFLVCSLWAGTALAQDWQEITIEGFVLRWATTSGTELSVELTGPTTGWIAVGFDPTAAMQNANIIIGYVASSTPVIRDDFGVGMFSHGADTTLGGTHDVTIDGGSEAGGSTEIKFTIPLDSGDSFDRVLSPGNSYTVILARGANGMDNFTSPHAVTAVSEINLLQLSLEQETWASVKAAY